MHHIIMYIASCPLQELGLTPESAWESGTPHRDDISAMDYCSPHYLATGSFDGVTVVWNTDTEKVVSQFRSMAKLKAPLP